jgi:uncharacterized protein (TIGR02231 family)
MPAAGAPMAAPVAQAKAKRVDLKARLAKGASRSILSTEELAASEAPYDAAPAEREVDEDVGELPELEPGEAWLDFDALNLAGVASARRGRLVLGGADRAAGDRRQASETIEALVPLGGVRDPLTTRGQFDHRYDAAGTADVPSDGIPHRVTVATGDATSALRWRTVPREAAEVYKEAQLQNPFAAPLLAGPVDVYVDGSLLVTSAIDKIDRGGRMTVGMGVEDRLRVARNARSDEDTAGLLGGSTVVTTMVTIDLTSSLGRDATVEVVDRIPVTDDKACEIDEAFHSPYMEPYDQAERGSIVRGGVRWREVVVPAGGKQQLILRYKITFSSKSEIQGGNRRD